ncbi:hypothetical protein F53441_14070 [Fusarium austroafricanum]|uniref:Uncharacterized protein n=1 Tax=Fusarium austroafricanum TaxID=2364996 RepID=A0A8H4JJX2_9HYPO|nr:hypothetical protein F53441_14070 [Fusarium austroafricanum]
MHQHGTEKPNFELNHLSSFKAERDQILFLFVSGMFPLGSTSPQNSFLGSWLWHLPPRLGSSTVLDYAALSVAWAYFSRMHGDPLALKNSELSYLSAVKSLALAIDNPKEQLSSNVLCATMLLGHYETFVNVPYAWTQHAGGAARLMQLRGAERCYESAFEYSMFLTCRAGVISEAFVSGKPCILEDKSWQDIPDGLIEFPLLPESPDMYHDIFSYFALVPGLQYRTRVATSDETRQSLLSTARNLRHNMQQWYHRFTSRDCGLRKPLVVAPISEDHPFHSQYIYHDIMSATMITTYYAYLILLNRTIVSLNPDDEETAENIELAGAICMSVDYCLHAGYCGTTTMRITLPIAHTALPVQYHRWINMWMDKFSAIMEATRIQALHS